jgi:hypothetical protein
LFFKFVYRIQVEGPFFCAPFSVHFLCPSSFFFQCVRGVVDPPVSAFSLSLYRHPFLSLSLYRHPFLYTLFSSHFTLIINNPVSSFFCIFTCVSETTLWWMSVWFECGGRLLGIWVGTWGRSFRWGSSVCCFSFKNTSRGTIPCQHCHFLQCSVFFATWDHGRRRPDEGFGFSCRFGCQWGYHCVWIVLIHKSCLQFSLSRFIINNNKVSTCMWQPR